ncbi:MAG: hypothetical protein LBI95_01545 [Holosporales bacterium]|nr:hypothetical protein [Holosporales bacterium]
MVYGLLRLGRLSHVTFEAGRVIQAFKTVVPDGASAFGAGRMVRASRHLWNIYVCGRLGGSLSYNNLRVSFFLTPA